MKGIWLFTNVTKLDITTEEVEVEEAVNIDSINKAHYFLKSIFPNTVFYVNHLDSDDSVVKIMDAFPDAKSEMLTEETSLSYDELIKAAFYAIYSEKGDLWNLDIPARFHPLKQYIGFMNCADLPLFTFHELIEFVPRKHQPMMKVLLSQQQIRSLLKPDENCDYYRY